MTLKCKISLCQYVSKHIRSKLKEVSLHTRKDAFFLTLSGLRFLFVFTSKYSKFCFLHHFRNYKSMNIMLLLTIIMMDPNCNKMELSFLKAWISTLIYLQLAWFVLPHHKVYWSLRWLQLLNCFMLLRVWQMEVEWALLQSPLTLYAWSH